MSVTRPVTQRVTQPVTLPVTIGAPTSALPIPLTAPVITGTTFVGDMLTVTPGTYLNATTVTGEWYVDGVATGVTNLTYVVDVDDAGLLIEWREEASNSHGSTQQTASVTAETLLANVQHLYANGEQGALYYFTEDFAGLYQDDKGTTPVTAEGQPVGLMLDRRFGLARGPDVYPSVVTPTTNGSLVVETLSNREFRFPGGGSGYLFVAIGLFPNTNSEFEVDWEFVADAGAMYGVRDDSLLLSSPYHMGRYRHIQKPRTANRLQFYAVAGTVGTLIIHSVRELPGNHASQATTTARPLLQRDANGKLHLEFDGVDDILKSSTRSIGVTSSRGAYITLARSRKPATGTGYQPSLAVGASGTQFLRSDSLRSETSGQGGASVRDDSNYTPAGGFRASLGAASDPVNVTSVWEAMLDTENRMHARRDAVQSTFTGTGSGFISFEGLIEVGNPATSEKLFGGLVLDREATTNERTTAGAFLARQAGIDLGNPSP